MKKTYQRVQLEYHTKCWKNLPKSLNKRVEKVFSNITPPMMDTSFIAELQDINN